MKERLKKQTKRKNKRQLNKKKRKSLQICRKSNKRKKKYIKKAKRMKKTQQKIRKKNIKEKEKMNEKKDRRIRYLVQNMIVTIENSSLTDGIISPGAENSNSGESGVEPAASVSVFGSDSPPGSLLSTPC